MQGKTSKAHDLTLHVQKTSYKDKIIEIEYEVQNTSSHNIWVCTSNNRNEYPNFESHVLKNEKKIVIQIKSFAVPPDVYLEEPIFAKYQRLLPGKSKRLKLNIELPVYDYSPLKLNKANFLNLEQLLLIKIEIGYFDKDLDKDTECCLKTSSVEELLVNCFWAEKNKEKSVSIEIKR